MSDNKTTVQSGEILEFILEANEKMEICAKILRGEKSKHSYRNRKKAYFQIDSKAKETTV